jgi:hypothetical protein
MVNKVRSLDFLPEIFRTVPNQQFLEATLDQLVNQPDNVRIQGYIGRKFEYGLDPKSAYVTEPNAIRTNYQLEPGIVFNNPDTSVAKDVLTYPELLDALRIEGAMSDNHSVLFGNEFYSWDSFVDLDKLINFSQYYWLPDGPDVVPVQTEYVNNVSDFVVTSETINYSFKENGAKINQANPTLTLVRGGQYTFNVSQDTKFWIQTQLGTSGTDTFRNNVSTREIFGITNNGPSQGVITFEVPQADAQDYLIYPGENYVDLISTLKISDLHGKKFSELTQKYPNGIIDGVNQIMGKSIMFYGYAPGETEPLPTLYDLDGLDVVDFDTVPVTIVNNNYYTLVPVAVDAGDFFVEVQEVSVIPTDQKITAINGTEFINIDFVRNAFGEISKIPVITAPLDTLYYQDGTNADKVGIIKILDANVNNAINVERDILGKLIYTGPNGVKFTNGLKVNFVGNIVPESYKKGSYYVEGVGTSIQLIPADTLLVAEPFSQLIYTMFDTEGYDSKRFGGQVNMPVQKDYITIHRSSFDKNAWTRSNRWFHIDVLKATAEYTKGETALAALNNKDNRANRPIVEFYPNIGLYEHGSGSKGSVQFIDTTSTDALNPTATDGVAGQTEYFPDGGAGFELSSGDRIIFVNDNDINVRNKIFVANVVSVDGESDPVIVLTPAANGDVFFGDQVFCDFGESKIGTSWYFDGTNWNQAQQKNFINQPPKFDVLDINGIGLDDHSIYPGSSFTGCTLFEYATGTGPNDPVLGFPLSYSSVANIGDISFRISLNDDTFTYTENFVSVTKNVSVGYPHKHTSRAVYTREIGWKKAVGESFQYQTYNFIFNPTLNNSTLTCDCLAKETTSTPWPTIRVYVDDKILTKDQYTVVQTTTQTKVTLVNVPTVETPVQILIHSDNKLGVNSYYSIPVNLASNPFNVPIANLSLGDIRGHYQSIIVNSEKVIGDTFGSNSYRDAGDLIAYGDKIIQNSAPLTVPAAFLRSKNYNLNDALTYNANEYVKFKSLVTNIINEGDYTIHQSAAFMLDDALQQIASYKYQSSPFFWSDMLPARAPHISNTYTFNTFIDTTFYTLSKIYDFTNASYDGVLIYLTRPIDGVTRTIQLVKGTDYILSDGEPKVTILTDLFAGDSITINEYNQTYGSYVPSTPSKLGLYPSYIPKVIYDESYVNPAYFLRGHDGSMTKLYGDYVNGFLVDFRDRVLFEFETRIYNNIKVSADIPVKYEDVVPGQFRKTDYSYEDIQNLMSVEFLNWVGQNRIDYKYQYYLSNEPFTFNYDSCTGRIDNELFKQGNWRGIFLYYYDTSTPHTTPWEMLGFSDMPSWWESRYGVAPYSIENDTLWGDLELGLNYNNGDPFIMPEFARPGLSKYIPVDSAGNLREPTSFLVATQDALTFKRAWKVGDVGPSEYAYKKSSTYPFDLIKTLAICKPAKFYALSQDLDAYKYNTEFGQYLVDDRYRLSYCDINYGTGVAQHGYMNWIVDYVQNTGIDGQAKLTELMSNLDVRLTYRLAGFSDKDLLKFYLEKSSNNSKNVSLLIPDDSYAVLLHENQPIDRIVYSGIIVQKTEFGFKVYGNSQNRAFFKTYTPKLNGNYLNLKVDSLNLYLSKDYTPTEIIVPYGTEYTSIQGLAEFILNYGRYLEQQGMQFTSVENGVQIDWEQMVTEVAYWHQTGWEPGSTISINPAANILSVNRENLIVQPLTLHQQNFVLNQNLVPVLLKDLAVERNGLEFKVHALNPRDTIAFFTANLSNMEHTIVFDNYTLFNDTIYNPITGLRQFRLLMKGVKTSEWNGTVDTKGFILNQDNVAEWSPNTKYSKNSLVKYKNSYWMANDQLQPSIKFNQDDWIKTNYEQIQKGLLPNASSRAYESTLYYDTNNTNLESDADLLAFSLIGYRPREYFAASNLDDISQVNVYRNMIAEKGTKLVADAMQNITLVSGQIKYDVYENWAIKTSEYSGVLNENFVEFVLDEQYLTGNPNIVGIIKDTGTAGLMQEVSLYNVSNFGRSLSDEKILPTIAPTYTEKLPSAGYVNFDDVKMSSYSYERLRDNIVPITSLYQGDYVWIADVNNQWKIYTAVQINNGKGPIRVTDCANNLNGTATITFSDHHNLEVDDPFVIISYDYKVDGYYRVTSVSNLNTVVIDLVLPSGTLNVKGTGIAAKFQSQRIDMPRDAADLELVNSGFTKSKVWVDRDAADGWAVYQKSINYTYLGLPSPTTASTYGTGLAYDTLGYFVADAGAGKLYLNTVLAVNGGTNYGTALVKQNNTMVVSKPGATSHIYVYDIVRSTTVDIEEVQDIVLTSKVAGNSLALSGDENWLYVGSITESSVFVYKRNDTGTYDYVTVVTVPGLSSADEFSGSISTTYDGSTLLVGTPMKNYSSTLSNTGIAYVFDRLIQNIDIKDATIAEGAREFTLAWGPQNDVKVYCNDVLMTDTTDYTIVYNKLTIIKIVKPGDIIRVSSGDFIRTQDLTGWSNVSDIRSGVSFGNSVDTNIYGSELIIGAPFEISSDNQEGAVHRFTDAGRKYGMVTGVTAANVLSPDSLLINGYAVFIPVTNIDGIVNAIMAANVPNVYATKTTDNKLIIGLIDVTLGPLNNKLNISATSYTLLQALGIQEYIRTQIITEPESVTGATQFGYTVKFNNHNSFAVSAPVAKRVSLTTFDFTDDELYTNDTIFDNNFTNFVDGLAGAGSVYIFDYMPAYNETLLNSGKYVFGQTANDRVTKIGRTPQYGYTLAFHDYTLMIGCPNYNQDSYDGRVVVYRNYANLPNWNVYRKSNEVVDVSRIQTVQLYNNQNNERLDALDYIDPLQGKLLGVVGENLDYIGSYDPAGYNTETKNGNLVWGSEFVGRIWFDTTTTRFVNYHQDDIVYNSKYWGKIFPGSTVTIYTWTESLELPLLYTGTGTPFNIDSYTTSYEIDTTGALVPKYYYWVRNSNILYKDKGKTLTDTVLELYITDPQSSGLSYFAAYQSNAYGLYNSRTNINAKNTSLHISFGEGVNKDAAYNEYKLIRDGYADDFLAGVPSAYTPFNAPESLYEKLLDSLTGIDTQGKSVPDINLPALMQQGISVRPRQSFFINRLSALKNYVIYANNVLKQYPISEFKTPAFLGATNQQGITSRGPAFLLTSGEFYNTPDYWEYVYWWADGYNDNTKTDVEVSKYYDLATLTPFENMVVGVKTNSDGKREVYVYADLVWTRVGLEQGTIQIKSSLYEYSNTSVGFGNNFFDTVDFDAFPADETRYIIRALNEEIFTNELQVHRNKSLILLFEFIVGEATSTNSYLPWLNKTSLADVSYVLRDLNRDLNYQKDNTTFLEGYINEVKPYHVKIKEFATRYTANSTFDGQFSDFDLPARYDSDLQQFITPNLVFRDPKDNNEFKFDSNVWTDTLYSDWYDNYGLSLVGKKDYNISSLKSYLSTSSTRVYLDNAHGIPVAGIIKIDDELIGYTGVDRDAGQLLGITRGVGDTDAVPHIPNTLVYTDLAGAIVLDTGRNYIDPPVITAYIDTTIYPTPLREAIFQPVMSNDRLIGVQVIDPGAGYANAPEIIVQSAYTIRFGSDNINFSVDLINIEGVELVTGDVVKYTQGAGSEIKGLIDGKYYYVGVISKDETFGADSFIALYETKTEALIDNHRIEIVYVGNNIGSRLDICARVVAIAANTPTRQITPILKFDRTSYLSKASVWQSNEYYASQFDVSSSESSLDISLQYALPYTELFGGETDDGIIYGETEHVSPVAETFEHARFTVYNNVMDNVYTVDVTFIGLMYEVGDVITIYGEHLGGTTPENNITITILAVDGIGRMVLTVDDFGVPTGYTVSGNVATDIILASRQSEVLNITNVEADTDDSVIVTTNYTGKNAAPAQLKGLPLYFYKIFTPVTYTDPISGGATVVFYRPDFVMNKVYNEYFIEIIDPGSTYIVGDKIIVDGSLLGGVDGINDATITVVYVENGEISLYNLSGIAVGQFDELYVKPISDTKLKVYYDAPMARPVPFASTYIGTASYPTGSVVSYGGSYYKARIDVEPTIVSVRDVIVGRSYTINTVGTTNWVALGAASNTVGVTFTATSVGNVVYTVGDVYLNYVTKNKKWDLLEGDTFPFNAGDYMYLPQPVIITSGYSRNAYSIVSFNNKLYKCIESNNDEFFNFNKWEEISSNDTGLNALDRIVGFYNPTSDMPGKNLPLLVSGIDYPNNTYYSNKFNETYRLDTILKDNPFYPKDLVIKSVVYDQGKLVAVGDNSDYAVVLISIDNGLSWNLKRISTQKLGVTDIIHTGSIYLVTTDNPQTSVYISYDGLSYIGVGNYTPYDATGFDAPGEKFDSTGLVAPINKLYNIASHGSVSVAVGDEIVYSVDGFSWESVFSFNSRAFSRLNFVEHITSNAFVGFIAVGEGIDNIVEEAGQVATSTGTVGKIVLSVDGRQWQEVWPRVTNSALYTVLGSTEYIVVAGENGTILYSNNGSNWEYAITSEFITDTIRSSTFALNSYVLVGDNGLILASYDGINFDRMESLTTQTLNSIAYNGEYFVAVGTDATVVRSRDGFVWENVSTIGNENTFYEIKGDPFMSGYGPEEMVPGLIADNLTMTITTRPGSTWNPETYEHTGFTVKTLTVSPLTTAIDFYNVTESPTQLAIFLLSKETGMGRRIYENITTSATNPLTYEVDWVNRVITLSDKIDPETEELLIEVYEFGNGNQVVRSNSLNDPIRVDELTGNSEIWINYPYEVLEVAEPIVYINGVKKYYGTDYVLASTITGQTKILLDSLYDVTTTYISYAVFGVSSDNYGYSIPETQVFEYAGSSIFTLTNFVGLPADGYVNDIDSIVELNGLRLINETDYTFDVNSSSEIGTVTVLTTLAADDVISVTTYNDTNNQYLITETLSDPFKVTPLVFINIEEEQVYLYSTIDPELSSGDEITIDGVIGTTQLNNNSYFIKVLDPVVEGAVTYYVMALYYDAFLFSAVGTIALAQYISDGYVWKTSQTPQLSQTIDLEDTTRVFVTVNGYKVTPSLMRLNTGNYLSILSEIDVDAGDIVTITSMVGSATPGQMTYITEIDKNGSQAIYRSNPNNRTWLTQPIQQLDDTIHVYDINRVVDIVTDRYIVEPLEDLLVVRVNYDSETIKQTTVYNVTSITGLASSEFVLITRNSVAYLVIRSGAVEGDELEVTMRLGDVILINGEKIRYQRVDYTTNTLSSLTRGIDGTGINTIHDEYASVVAINPTNTMFNFYYNRTWNSENYNVNNGDPLQISDTIPARFLQTGVK